MLESPERVTGQEATELVTEYIEGTLSSPEMTQVAWLEQRLGL
jgi:hypothetical protein